MRVFLDGRTAYGGVGRHVRWLRRELSSRLGSELVLYAGRDRGNAGDHPTVGSKLRGVAGAAKRIAVDQMLIPGLVLRSRVDLFHSPNYLAPRALTVPAIVTCFDLTLLDHLDTKKRGPMKYYERRVLLGALARARFVTTPSETVRRQLLERFDLEPARLVAIPPAPPELPIALGAKELPDPARGPFFLTVGTLEPRKNLGRLLEAHEGVWRRARIPLLVVGRYGWRQRAIVERARRSDGSIHWLGWVSDEILGALYRRATAVIQPSLAEGFDLPVLEAMAAGSPLIVSELAVHREVAGELGLYAPALDPDALAERMEEVLGWDAAKRSSHARLAIARAAEIGSRANIERYLALYRRALAG